MPRKISSDLFDLIRSLKKSEKRYFKLFSERHVIGGSNKYVTLFDAFEKEAKNREQEEYNEKNLFQKNPKLSPHLFSDQKTNLYELLLKSLNVYHSNERVEYKLRSLLNNEDILISKSLFS